MIKETEEQWKYRTGDWRERPCHKCVFSFADRDVLKASSGGNKCQAGDCHFIDINKVFENFERIEELIQ